MQKFKVIIFVCTASLTTSVLNAQRKGSVDANNTLSADKPVIGAL